MTDLVLLSIAIGLGGKPDPETASLFSAQLEGAVDSLKETIGQAPWARNDPFVQNVYGYIRSHVDAQIWEAARKGDQMLTIEQAINLVDRIVSVSSAQEEGRSRSDIAANDS
jgi:hypothetical protein